MEVEIKFKVEASEPQHRLGLSSDHWEDINRCISDCGGYDIEADKIREDHAPKVTGPSKKAKK